MIRSFIKDNNLKYLENASLRKYNTYRLDTIADFIVFPSDIKQLIVLIRYLKENNIRYLVLGNGSNVIFKDDVFKGVIIKLSEFNYADINRDTVRVGAGYSLVRLSLDTANMSLSGLEFASGIPGEVGASTAMNAGAYNSSMSDIVTKVKVLTPSLEVIELENKDLSFSYRHSFFKDNKDYIILEVEMKLEKGNKEEILSLIKKRRERRMASQPLEYPSAGSVFRNPNSMHAGELIEECGLKGYSLNGIEISTKHANFIVNKNNGRGKEIVELIDLIKNKVRAKYNVELILEQEIIE